MKFYEEIRQLAAKNRQAKTKEERDYVASEMESFRKQLRKSS